MSDEPISLAARRVEKTQDCRDWSVVDCLKEAIRSIEAGEIDPSQVVVLLYRDIEDKPGRLWQRNAGVTRHGTIALLSVAHQLATQDYVDV